MNDARQGPGAANDAPADSATAIRRIVGAIDRPLVKLYSSIRFYILRQRFIEEIGQYLPAEGRVLDAGCGFGLFTNYFAQTRPGCSFEGFDNDRGRIEMAREIARRLDIGNASFQEADLAAFEARGEYQAAYMLDILHHVTREQAVEFLARVAAALPIGGRLILKDVLCEPRYKALFSLLLDRLMVGRGFIRYWDIAEMKRLLRVLGFECYHHEMVDWLPYSHVIFSARKVEPVSLEAARHTLMPDGRYHFPS